MERNRQQVVEQAGGTKGRLGARNGNQIQPTNYGRSGRPIHKRGKMQIIVRKPSHWPIFFSLLYAPTLRHSGCIPCELAVNGRVGPKHIVPRELSLGGKECESMETGG